MDFKKIVWLFVFFVAITKNISAQTDSTDLNFYATAFVPTTLEDSLTYGINNLSKLYLEFEIDDIANFGKVWIEVISYDTESEVSTLFYQSYTGAELTDLGFIEDANVEIELTILELMFSYQIVIRLEDNLGHEKISLTKYLAE